MAATEEWFVGEDGCISVGEPTASVTYHSSLNTIIVVTKEPALKVIDVTSGSLLQKSNLSACKSDAIHCMYLPVRDRLVFWDEHRVGVRKDLSGVMLLDTALQASITKTEAPVCVELPLAEATHLFKSLVNSELPGVDYIEEVLKELEKGIDAAQEATKGNHKTAKWATVTLMLPHCALKSVCGSLVMEMKRLHHHSPGLSVASAVNDRLSYLLPSTLPDISGGNVDRSLMFSEAARRATFGKWPHMNYKWALPEPMAQAGFYHQPNSLGDDRAMCFTCNVCLVCWEPTDEPWSEHERHSPSCPFVKGEYTQNVPLSVTHATQPACFHGDYSDKIECLSPTNSENYLATSTLNGNVVVWSIGHILKKHCQFNIEPSDSVIALKTGLQRDKEEASGSKPADGARSLQKSPSPSTPEPVEEGESRVTPGMDCPPVSLSTSTLTNCIQEIPLHHDPAKESRPQRRTRPSQDVRVHSLCIVDKQKLEKLEQAADNLATAQTSSSPSASPSATSTSSSGSASSPVKGSSVSSTPCPSLLCGVSLRTGKFLFTDSDDSENRQDDMRTDVQLMNKVNEVVSTDEPPQIITDSQESLQDCTAEISSFIPYLLVVPIRPEESRVKGSSCSGEYPLKALTSASNVLPLHNCPIKDDWGPLDPIYESDIDPDIQIVGITPPPGKTTFSNSVSDSQKLTHSLVNGIPEGKMENAKEFHPESPLNVESKPVTVLKGYSMLQCVELPSCCQCESLVINAIIPTVDNCSVIVTLVPKEALDINVQQSDRGGKQSESPPEVDTEASGAGTRKTSPAPKGGYILIYKLKVIGEFLGLEETPSAIREIDNVGDAVTSILTLPLEFSLQSEEEETPTEAQSSSVLGQSQSTCAGQVAVTTAAGNVQIINLSNLTVCGKISPMEGDKFVSLTYCSGMERLCASSSGGKLHFYQISQHNPDFSEQDNAVTSNHSRLPQTVVIDGSDVTGKGEDQGDQTPHKSPSGSDILAKQPLTTESLMQLHDLIQLKTLCQGLVQLYHHAGQKYSKSSSNGATPQHLQHQGEATQHTRTWKLQTDSNTWDEHLFELVLPRPCYVGHVDVKFSLHSMCMSPPKVEVTLLKQNISNIGRQTGTVSSSSAASQDSNSVSSNTSLPTADVDEAVGFNGILNHGFNPQSKSDKQEPAAVNNVLDPAFLEMHNAEILCGPVDIGSCLDLSCTSGIISLTSPQLFSCKPRSFLVHIKALASKNSEKEEKPKVVRESKKKSSVAGNSHSGANEKQKSKTIKALFENIPYNGSGLSAMERLAATAPKAKLENLKGCDFIQEISVTVRKCKKSNVPKERLQRCAMLELASFQERLLGVACAQDQSMEVTTSWDHCQNLALDILSWITSIQMNDPDKRDKRKCVVLLIQQSLTELVKACFISGTRATAHKCARLIALCIEYSKNCTDPDLAPTFSYVLLNSLLDSLPLLPYSYSAGGLKWYFTLLNRAKCMNVGSVAEKCVDMLTCVAKQYSERTNPAHSLLKTRYGLYGHPFEVDLFDTDPPPTVRVTSSSYASVVGGCVTNSASASTVSQGQDEVDFRDLFMSMPDKSSGKSQYEYLNNSVLGLLEVEPLHFTCHSTSDGTRMERLDVLSVNPTSNPSNTSVLSGTINFGEGLSSGGAAGAALGMALSSLSTAMSTAEQQLQQLQSQQYQLMKLQQQKQKLEQKLAESTKSGSGVGVGNIYTSELFPPTPKTTPLFMTPPVTPPNESWQQGVLSYGLPVDLDPGKPPLPKGSSKSNFGKYDLLPSTTKSSLPITQTQNLLQTPPPQVLVIERMHSGARRFVTLDFGKPILLTDLIIPACMDLASLSIDVWIQGEEVDGQRLVVASDIGMRSLIMNNIMPPPICRYLKITTIGRYGGSTTRSRIPIGTFYGHSYILPWEWNGYAQNLSAPSTSSAVNLTVVNEQPQLLSQLGLLVSLQEDIQCRYSLAKARLENLLGGLDSSQHATSHTQYFLKKTNKNNDEDNMVIQAYHDCLQLQLQFNLAQRAIHRLRRAFGIHPVHMASNGSLPTVLKQTATDKLRFVLERLLDTLLGMTVVSLSNPQLPTSLYSALNPGVCESLFRHLCVVGGKHMQIHTGMLLVRICGSQPWWGEFLGNVLQEFFNSEQSQLFPRDRVFILITALGQRSLMGPSACSIMESLLGILARILSPLIPSPQAPRHQSAWLDLSLIGWILLFLCRNLDNGWSSLNNSEDDKAGASSSSSRDNGTNMPNRWSFIQGEAGLPSTKTKSRSTVKRYRSTLQKRLMHHKQKLMDLDQAKKKFYEKSSTSTVPKEAQNVLKQQEQLFKKEFSQYASKHLKDIVQIRRTDGEILKKLPKDENGGNGSKDSDSDSELPLILPREKCLPVVRGLMSLILSMDFTCNVDLFLIASKVFARICIATRPAISLSEAMTQEQLERLIMLSANFEFNHGNVAWGGPWAGHAITCLLQDILDGEKLYPSGLGLEGVTDDEISGTMTETDESLANSVSLPTIEETISESSEIEVLGKDSPVKGIQEKHANLMDMAYGSDEGEYYDVPPPNVTLPEPPNDENAYQIMFGQPSAVKNSQLMNAISVALQGPDEKKKLGYWTTKVADYLNSKPSGSQGVSTAMDSRLECGLDTQPELRLKMMMSILTENIQVALTSALPVAPPTGHSLSQSKPPTTDEEQLSEASFLASINIDQGRASSLMLSQCFDSLFAQLLQQRVNLDSLLQLWLTLNEDSINHDDGSTTSFDPARSPSILLNQTSVTSLLAALAWIPNIPVSTWVLAFHVLTLLCNQRVTSAQQLGAASSGSASSSAGLASMASLVIADSNLTPVLMKFLSGMVITGPSSASFQSTQVGPSATKAFFEFLSRLRVKSAEENEQSLKELLLKVVYSLTADRGAFYSGLGPLDAQCRFLDFVLDLAFDQVEISNAISVIESISCLVHQHILCQERVTCKSSSEVSVNARSCFGGMFANLLRGSDSRSNLGNSNRDVLMCSLLKLVNSLVQIKLPERYGRSTSASVVTDVAPEPRTPVSLSESITDSTKLSQALATSTPAASTSISDEEKARETDASSGAPSSVLPGSSRAQSSQPETRPPTVSDNPGVFLAEIILGHRTIMSNLIQALSYCNSNTMAMIIGSSGLSGNMQDTVTSSDPLSVGDGIYQILCTLTKKCSNSKLILEPIYAYLSGHQRGQGSLSRLSEPLIWFILKILDSVQTIRNFLNMGGVEVICENLVSCNQRIISSNPSLISTIMHHLSNGKPGVNEPRKSTDVDSSEGWHNFAPLGTITSSSPTASPADVLIQASPPHRRARSAAWSYHFYPDEAWVDLTIQLPFAVLLKEVQIQPHLTSLATCPAFVSLEISRDGSTVTPLCPPLMTSSLAFIKLQLQKPEIATSVIIRLHKARDSTTIGLSQVLLMGYSAFGESGYKTGNIFLPTEDLVSRTSFGWLRLLHHCLTAHDEVTEQVSASAALVPNLLTTCMALLVSPVAGIYATNMEAVLLKIGLHSSVMGLALIDNILKNVSTLQETDATVPYLGKVNGIANDSTIEILYRLGITQDHSTVDRIRALAQWLGDSAGLALQRTSMFAENSFLNPQASHNQYFSLPNPAPAHIHCIGAILWQSRGQADEHALRDVITKDLVSAIYKWSMVLPADSPLKRTVDFVLCSLCYIRPEFFTLVLEWIGVVVDVNSSASLSITDDTKDHNSQYDDGHGLTDDSKEACSSTHSAQPIRDNTQGHMTFQRFGHLTLDECHLRTLATACKSPTAIKQLLDTGFPAVLAQGVFEFCSREMHQFNTEHLSPTEGMTDQSKSMNGSTSGREGSNNVNFWDRSLNITPDLMAAVLNFFAEVASEVVMKDWLGGPEGNIFWPALLTMLCNTLPPQPANGHTLHNKHKVTTVEERAAVETAAVSLFSQVIFCHMANQHLFAKVLCDVIKGQGEVKTGVISSASPLSGFTRRLFLQVLLEDEKLLVAIQTTSKQFRWEINKINSHIQHPKFGAGRLYRTMVTSLQSTCGQVISKVSDTPTLTASIMEQQEKKRTEDPKKDTSELGMEVVEYLSTAAGVSAKERREKSPAQKNLPPRPPSRRGRHTAEVLAAELNIPTLSLHHELIPRQPLPSELTLSQLLTLLYQHGLAQGCSSLEFTMKLSRKRIAGSSSTSINSDPEESYESEEVDLDRLPDDLLLETPACQSALHVFASVGGLALLAEHLPLLYPEITRQATVGETEHNSAGDMIGSDWVTVEPSDDYYEPFYEPMSPAPQSNSRPTKQAPAALPTIPPHSLVAFGLFLRLPGYAEVLLKERKKAQCLLRLVLGVTDDGDGGHILTSPIAGSLPTLPFHVLKTLFDVTAPSTDDGVLLRRMTLEIGALHLILACLSVLSHHAPRSAPPVQNETVSTPTNNTTTPVTEEKTHHYWAKGTGFGTGSTTSSWDAEQALLRQKSEEEHVTCLLQVLGSYINSGGTIPKGFQSGSSSEEPDDKSCLPAVVPELLTQSCLVPAICSYLRNDSVLDMARHVPLYRALLELLRGLAVCPSLVPLLLPLDKEDSGSSIGVLLEKMKGCVDTYASRLKSNKSKGGNGSGGGGGSHEEEEENEGLALLIPDIQETARIVQVSTDRLKDNSDEMADCGSESDSKGGSKRKRNETADERYINTMKELQFDTYEMVVDEGNGIKFTLNHHYESNVKATGDVNNPARARRLAQEAVTLSTSLPLSASSSVFVRCDEERLDVMKVLITGPSGTPYANGGFEFDVCFPQDYPNSPPNINLETTGNHTVRFNPNLYNDGKVCLSVLNTWHGRPEEKWNAQTSSFLQVLVSIQSLILVSEPYFNEPGYERSRGTPPGTASSREYDANIRQATVKWGMLEQLRNPSPCFKEVVHKHFWLKRHEILRQCEEWISEMEGYTSDKRTGRSIAHSIMALKRHYNQLREELAKLKPPADLEEEEEEDEPIDPQEKQYSTEQGAGPGPGATAPEGAEKEMTSTSAQTATFPDPVPPQADFGGHLEFIMLGEDVVDC
ncbi:baculoviral IAP repeat-containing protein 6-like isoform X3 [Liolophura sinensis]|uniref:baculoviral IAP repeat-containing protein 6-like isoform X3 n=1 Tax=Liolophura sinensis TaxID=3198878 RepID=UPI0031582502